MQLRPPGFRLIAAASALGLVAGLAAVAPGTAAQADVDPQSLLGQALADPTSAASTALDPGIVAHLPHDLTFSLSPELAAAFGRSTLTADEAAGLLAQRGSTPAASPNLIPVETPAVGTKRMWPALDITGATSLVPLPQTAGLYLKEYTLQAKQPNIEVWVASGADDVSTGTNFPEGDCRAAVKNTTTVTRAQAQSLAKEFQDRQLPVLSDKFSVAQPRNGTFSVGQVEALGLDFRGSGESVVTLVDNVRDPNFYDFDNNRTYIAGFFTTLFNDLTDRNVQSIDAFDWEHRTGANPKNEPDEDFCLSRPARPQQYESTFAHEYQHLLMSYTDPDEDIWINEGLADMVPFYIGYDDPRLTVKQTGGESHIYCFQGFGRVKGAANPNPNPAGCGGPENSLTQWRDQGGLSDILADYGNTWSFLLYLQDRYGGDFMSALHRDGVNGLPGVQAQLDEFADGRDVMDVMHDFQLMNLLDNQVSRKGVKVVGADRSDLVTKSLKSAVNYRVREAYIQPGAALNGVDYVQLRKDGKFLAGDALRSLSFTGAKVEAGEDAAPIENWMVRLVGIDSKGKRVLIKSYDEAFDLTLSAAQLKAFKGYKTVIAVVGVDDSTVTDRTPAAASFVPYTLTVNGAVQPGGAA